MTQREIFKKYDNLSKNELNAKNNKEVYAKMVLWRLLLNVPRLKKKKRSKRKIQKKIGDSRIWNFRMPRIRLKSKIGKIFVNEKILEEYSVKIYEIDPYFHEHYKKTTTTTTTTKKNNLMKIYYSELMLIFLNIF